jgi:D-3-phosphoglycerate dehydrogenase
MSKQAGAKAKQGVRVVNVGGGPVIEEPVFEAALQSGEVYSAALDVFEIEPSPMDFFTCAPTQGVS